MGVFFGKKLLFITLPLIASAALFCAAQANPAGANGSLAGTLTDVRSSPLASVTVTLRNERTGLEVHSITSRAGRYRFSGLEEGEYTLSASGPAGVGQVSGIFVAAGHEAKVQTAIQLVRPQASAIDAGAAKAVGSAALDLLRNRVTQSVSIQATERLAATSIEPESLAALRIHGTNHGTSANAAALAPLLTPGFSAQFGKIIPALEPASVLASGVTGARVEPLELVSLPAAVLGSRSVSKIQAAITMPSESVPSAESLTSAQIQTLPLAGRDWRSFMLDTPAQSDDNDQVRAASGAVTAAPEITIDGVRMQSPVSRTRDRSYGLISAGSGEAAVNALQTAGGAGLDASSSTGNSLNVETRRGTEHLHGQAFLFDRENLWGARNPFTQWVKETAPASTTTIAAFAPQPYSPGDRELLWGAGIGGIVHHPRVLWFAALDGFARNDPGVATVKHPDDFFAQPSNDQMQLLSAQLGLSSANPVSAGVSAYSKLLESLSTLLGPSPRQSSQWIAFARADWSVAERHRFTVETSDAVLDSPGGGFTRASEPYGTHSFGSVHATQQWLLARWQAFLTPNLLAVTQASFGHQVESEPAEAPSPFEQSLNISAWGQLPQIVVDSRYGFTIGNPARFGRGRYPDQHLTTAQEQLNWVRGGLLFKAGFEIEHDNTATSRLRNQTGTYHYSSVEDFASDALAFSTYGLHGLLNPMEPHNCDQRGTAWRDASGTLHGLGYLPCYSYYSQTIGPADWWVSTDNWAGYLTSQWQPTRRSTLTVAMRWELEQLPPPIGRLDNPDLPLTQQTPHLGSQWGPRAGFAWGKGESRLPIVRLGYGMYFVRTHDSVLESVLTQTGSMNGDLNIFMCPTDNLIGGGAPPFPYVLAGNPGNVVKPGAIEFAPGYRNGEVHQAEASAEETLPGHVHIEASAVASLGRRLPVTVDANVDPAVNPKTITYAVIDGSGAGPIKSSQITVPFFASWPSPTGLTGRLNPNYQQVSEIFSRANSTYEAAVLRVSRNAGAFTLRARYTYAHTMDWNPDETAEVGGPSVLDPNDFRQEYGTSSLDIRHSARLAVIWQPRWKLANLAGTIANGWTLSGVGYFHSGLPYTMRTAGSLPKIFNTSGAAIVGLHPGINGYGGDNRVYGVGRNTYRYPATWKADLRLAKRFNLGPMRQLELLAESFNLFNHQNVTQLETTGYLIEPGSANGTLPSLNFLTGLKTGQTEFAKPLDINATDYYRERQIQLGARLRF